MRSTMKRVFMPLILLTAMLHLSCNHNRQGSERLSGSNSPAAVV